MSGAKPWQIALIVIGLLAGVAGVVFAFTRGDSVAMANSTVMVDVTTGNLYRIDLNNRSITVPMKHGESGERVLLHARKDAASDKWAIPERYRPALQQFRDIQTIEIDRESGVIDIPESSSPKAVSW
ncbi:MAG: hypothetical protein AAFN41_10185 [Planctomycetota bacterium]